MNRMQLRAPKGLRRRPLRARRVAVAHDIRLDLSELRATPRWAVVGTGVLGLVVAAELVVGIVVVSL